MEQESFELKIDSFDEFVEVPERFNLKDFPITATPGSSDAVISRRLTKEFKAILFAVINAVEERLYLYSCLNIATPKIRQSVKDTNRLRHFRKLREAIEKVRESFYRHRLDDFITPKFGEAVPDNSVWWWSSFFEDYPDASLGELFDIAADGELNIWYPLLEFTDGKLRCSFPTLDSFDDMTFYRPILEDRVLLCRLLNRLPLDVRADHSKMRASRPLYVYLTEAVGFRPVTFGPFELNAANRRPRIHGGGSFDPYHHAEHLLGFMNEAYSICLLTPGKRRHISGVFRLSRLYRGTIGAVSGVIGEEVQLYDAAMSVDTLNLVDELQDDGELSTTVYDGTGDYYGEEIHIPSFTIDHTESSQESRNGVGIYLDENICWQLIRNHGYILGEHTMEIEIFPNGDLRLYIDDNETAIPVPRGYISATFPDNTPFDVGIGFRSSISIVQSTGDDVSVYRTGVVPASDDDIEASSLGIIKYRETDLPDAKYEYRDKPLSISRVRGSNVADVSRALKDEVVEWMDEIDTIIATETGISISGGKYLPYVNIENILKKMKITGFRILFSRAKESWGEYRYRVRYTCQSGYSIAINGIEMCDPGLTEWHSMGNSVYVGTATLEPIISGERSIPKTDIFSYIYVSAAIKNRFKLKSYYMPMKG